MSQLDDGPNAAQVAYWNDTAGPTWVTMQDVMDVQLGDLGLKAVAALGVRPGERVIDVGCGCGGTTIELARRVGEAGRVLGADISAPMLAVARQRAGALGLGWASFEQADAQTHRFEPADAAFSRFGVMFFADPAAAFANLRAALGPGGRLAFVCWREAAQNDWMMVPMRAVAPLVAPTPPPPAGAPGPFAFADKDRLAGILSEAGFGEIAIDPNDQRIGANDLETAVRISLAAGPVGAAVRDNPQLRPRIAEAVRAALEPHVSADGVKLGSASWIVTAR
jgi:SAM-dependent methyltransferase